MGLFGIKKKNNENTVHMDKQGRYVSPWYYTAKGKARSIYRIGKNGEVQERAIEYYDEEKHQNEK